MKVYRKIVNCIWRSPQTPDSKNEKGTAKTEASEQNINAKKYPKHNFLKKLFNHRYKLVFLPLIELVTPTNNPIKPEETANIRVVNNKEEPEKSSIKNYIPLSSLSPVPRALAIWALLVNFDLILFLRPKRIALHELGHFIGAQVTQFPFKPAYINAGLLSANTGIERNEEYEKKEFDDIREEIKDVIKLVCAHLVRGKAGTSIEKLISGNSCGGTDLLDKINIGITTAKTLKYLWERQPQLIPDFLLFRLQLEKFTQELLKQVDPEVFLTLANELSRETYWDSEKIQEMIRAYNLDGFANFEDKIPLVKNMLTKIDKNGQEVSA